MLTLHAIPAAQPVLVGRLMMHRFGRVKGRPVLSCSAWCPWCKAHHAVEWPDPPFALEGTVEFKTPCSSDPLAGSTIAVGLDPERRAEHGRLIREFSASLRRWRVEQRLRHLSAEEREADRAHRREWDIR